MQTRYFLNMNMNHYFHLTTFPKFYNRRQICTFKNMGGDHFFFFMHRYHIVKNIGEGSFGNVFLVKDKQKDGMYAVLKKIPAGKKKSQWREQVQKEAQILQKLDHPNIIQYYDSFFTPNEFCLVLEYANALDLDKYMRKHSELKEYRIIQIMSQIIFGLAYLHSKKIVHRDIKLANIFLFHNGLVKIGDFGISREVSPEALLKTVIGTPYFMAPEIFDTKGYGEPVDIWAAGCVLYKLMTGMYPFIASSREELIMKFFTAEPPEITENYSQFLKDLVKQMLSKDPSKRPTAKEILQMPKIRDSLRNLEEKITSSVAETPRMPIKEPSSIEPKRENSEDEAGDDVPEWILKDPEVHRELIRQSVHKLQDDVRRLQNLVRQSVSRSPIVIPKFSSDLNTRRREMEATCKSRFGEDKYNKVLEFVRENWTEKREEIPSIINWDHYPEEEMKLIDSIMMIDRFLTSK